MNRRDLLKAIPSISLTSIFSLKLDFREYYLGHIFHEDKYNISKSEVGGVTYYYAFNSEVEDKELEYSYDLYNDIHCYTIVDMTSDRPPFADLGEAESAIKAKQILQNEE